MPNGREHYKYEDFGPHIYSRHDGTSNCKHNCGCWIGPCRSGGPAGVDPFGKCPRISLNNKGLSQNQIMDDFINARIEFLENQIRILKKYEKTVVTAKAGTKIKLIEKINFLEVENLKTKNHLKEIMDCFNTFATKLKFLEK